MFRVVDGIEDGENGSLRGTNESESVFGGKERDRETRERRETNSRVSENVLDVVSKHHLMEDLSSGHSNEPIKTKEKKQKGQRDPLGEVEGARPVSRNFISFRLPFPPR